MKFLRETLAVRVTVLEVKYVRTRGRTNSALLTPPNALMDLLSSHDLGKESWQDERHPRGFEKRTWKRCVQ
jgi:hypothetical protein